MATSGLPLGDTGTPVALIIGVGWRPRSHDRSGPRGAIEPQLFHALHCRCVADLFLTAREAAPGHVLGSYAFAAWLQCDRTVVLSVCTVRIIHGRGIYGWIKFTFNG